MAEEISFHEDALQMVEIVAMRDYSRSCDHGHLPALRISDDCRVLIVGKRQQMHWPETVAHFLPITHQHRCWCYNDNLAYSLGHFLGKSIGTTLSAKAFRREIETFRPHIVILVSCFFIPEIYYRILERYSGIIRLGWCADRFDTNAVSVRANRLDYLFCSDTGFLSATKEFNCRCSWLPLCANETIFRPLGNKRGQIPPFFVGEANLQRVDFLQKLKTRCVIYGRNWPKMSQHKVVNKRLSYAQANKFINRSAAPFNLNFSKNNVCGLNFRPYEISAAGRPIITNANHDLSLCYDVGKEALSFSTPAELDDILSDVMNNPERYAALARAGHARTLSEHTFTHRLQQMWMSICQ